MTDDPTPVAPSTVHIPILVRPIVDALMEPLRALPADASAHWLVDCTLGGGGHTAALLGALAAEESLRRHRVLACDQDQGAVDRARQRFAREIAEGRLEIQHARFTELEPLLKDRPVLGMMADLGFSSDQIEDPERGLSFLKPGPLDMRLDPSRGMSCREYLQRCTENELEKVLREYGEERFAGRIARTIVDARRAGNLPRTTTELADLIVHAVPPPARYGRIHAATRTFQALRILLNEELDQLDYLLEHAILALKAGGRIAILSFHSLEDRRVKLAFRGSEGHRPLEPITRKPIEADEEELRLNPRARSAKLRIAERIG